MSPILENYTSEDVYTIVLRFKDRLDNEEFDNSNGMDAADKIENLYSGDYYDGVLVDLLALDSNGEVLAHRTARQFFEERLGF